MVHPWYRINSTDYVHQRFQDFVHDLHTMTEDSIAGSHHLAIFSQSAYDPNKHASTVRHTIYSRVKQYTNNRELSYSIIYQNEICTYYSKPF